MLIRVAQGAEISIAQPGRAFSIYKAAIYYPSGNKALASAKMQTTLTVVLLAWTLLLCFIMPVQGAKVSTARPVCKFSFLKQSL